MTFSPLLLSLIQLAIVVLLTADRWVHKVTGKASLESRVELLEVGQGELRKMFREADERIYRKLGEIQRSCAAIELLQARQDEHFKATDNRVDALTRQIERLLSAG